MKNYLLVLLIALSLASSTFQGMNQWDLVSEEFLNNSLQPSDLEGWIVEGNQNNNELTNCGDTSIVGGYQAFGKGATLSKTYADLPKHYKVKVLVTVYFVDSWDNEFFQIFANDQEVMREKSHLNWHYDQLCGTSNWGERVAQLEVEFAHHQHALNLKFGSTLNEGSVNESWGVRDVQVFIKDCDVGCSVLAEEFTNNDFAASDFLDHWVPNRELNAENLVQDCEGHKMIGGYNNFFNKFSASRTWENLPAHIKLVVSFDLWQIDSWDTNESFRVNVDNKSAFSTVKSLGFAGGQYQCGNAAWKDQLLQVAFEIPHHGDSFTIKLEDFLNEAGTNESWGFANFRVYMIECEEECQQISSELSTDSFNADSLAGWVDENGEAFTATTACGRTSLAGGFNELSKGSVSKTFTELPKHTHIMVSAEVWFIDHWNGEDFSIAVDQIPGVTTTKSKGQWTVDLGNACGSNGSEEVQLLWVEMPHFSQEATISLISKLNQAPDNESWGFRDVNVYVVDRAPGKLIATDLNGELGEEEIGEWTIEGSQSETTVNQCGEFNILGGKSVFNKETKLSRSFTGLPDHDYVTLYFKVYYIDQWSSELFQVQVDGQQAKQLFKYTSEGLAGTELCGSANQDDFVEYVEMTFRHSQADLDIDIYTLGATGADEFWGIREFSVYYGANSNIIPECPTIYSECGFKGRKLSFCDDVENFNANNWNWQVKSVYVPEGWEVTLYNRPEFDGESHAGITESIECLENGPVYSFIQITNMSKVAQQSNTIDNVNQAIKVEQKSKKTAVINNNKVEHRKSHLRANAKRHN